MDDTGYDPVIVVSDATVFPIKLIARSKPIFQRLKSED